MSDSKQDDPKSIIYFEYNSTFIYEFLKDLIKIFSGFKSQCIIFIEWIKLKPIRICLAIFFILGIIKYPYFFKLHSYKFI